MVKIRDGKEPRQNEWDEDLEVTKKWTEPEHINWKLAKNETIPIFELK